MEVGAIPVAETAPEGDPSRGVRVATPAGEPLAPGEPLALELRVALVEGAPLPLPGAVPQLDAETPALPEEEREGGPETEAVGSAMDL